MVPIVIAVRNCIESLLELDALATLTQINTDDLALHLLLATLSRVPSPESSAGDSGGRGASESSARELKSSSQ